MGVKRENITIVLHKPKYPGNIGSVARCAKNMGMGNITVVGGQRYEIEEIKQMATHFAADLVDRIQYHDELGEALAKFQYIVGTTSRRGAARGPFVSPREMAEVLVDISQNNEVALLFGPEDMGLANDELRYSHLVVTIPASQEMKSINLSHAVMILCYEIFVTRLSPLELFTPRLASSGEIEGMYGQIKELLMRIGFLKPENPDLWMMHIRRFFSRTRLYSREVKIIRGICRQLEWYMRHKIT